MKLFSSSSSYKGVAVDDDGDSGAQPKAGSAVCQGGPLLVTGSQRPSFPNILMRKGGSRSSLAQQTTGMLIDLDDSPQAPAAAAAAAGFLQLKRNSNNRGREVAALEMVPMPTDPFDLFFQSRTQQPSIPPAHSQGNPLGITDLLGPLHNHPLQQQQTHGSALHDPLQAPNAASVAMDRGRHEAGSSGSGGSGQPAAAAWVPEFGSRGGASSGHEGTGHSGRNGGTAFAGGNGQGSNPGQGPGPNHVSSQQGSHIHNHSAAGGSGCTSASAGALHHSKNSGGLLGGSRKQGGTSEDGSVHGHDRRGGQVPFQGADLSSLHQQGYESDPQMPRGSRTSGTASGTGAGSTSPEEQLQQQQRSLLLFAIPLMRDKLVFLPVVTWKDEADTSTVMGKMSAGINNMQQGLSNMWHSLKDKEGFANKVYKAGQGIMENMNAEERLMRNIPKGAAKMVIHFPTDYGPEEIQDQLTSLTSNFCVKSAGKAAVAGVMLPVAVGLEVIAVPGIGWYTAYQLFKSTSAAAGGSRLNKYLSDKAEIRINYRPDPRLDPFVLKARLSPDEMLGVEEIEDLVHDVEQLGLLHPLTELRTRYLKKADKLKADYALLPMNAPDNDDDVPSSVAAQKKEK